jgi:hypothetical protein
MTGLEGSAVLTHWTDFSKDAKDENGFQDEEGDEEDQRYELVKGVESVCPVIRVGHGVLPVVGEGESSVECNVACADKESGGRAENKSNGRDSSVVEDLISNDSIHKQNPESGYDRGNVDCCECYPYGATKREPADGEDLAYGDDDVSYEEKLHFSVDSVSSHSFCED